MLSNCLLRRKLLHIHGGDLQVAVHELRESLIRGELSSEGVREAGEHEKPNM